MDFFQYFWRSFHLFFSISAIFILAYIFSGQTYIRGPIAGIKCNGSNVSDQSASKNAIDLSKIANQTDRNVPNSWPFKMELRLFNYGCTTPTTKFNVTEEVLIAAWHLPPKTNLSRRMRAIGRCHLVGREFALRGIDFDTSRCNCVSSWPASVIFALFAGLFFNIICLALESSVEKRGFRVSNWIKMMVLNPVITFIQSLFWYAAAFPISEYLGGQADLGLWYIRDGSVDPVIYYGKSPDWCLVFRIICVIIGMSAFLAGASMGFCCGKMCGDTDDEDLEIDAV